MKKIILTFVLIGAIYYSLSAKPNNNLNTVAKQEYPILYTSADKMYGLSLLWSEIKYNFANIDLLEFDIDSLYQATIPQILNTSNDIEYFDIIERFLASMQDGHTQILNTPYEWSDYYDYIPANIIETDKKFYFSSVRKNAGLNPRLFEAEIIEIEGISTKEYVEKNILPNICTSTENMRWYEASGLMQQGLKNTYFRGKARTSSGEVVPFSILRNGSVDANENNEFDSWKSIRIPRQQVITLEWIDDIAFLDIRAFTPDVPAILDSIMPQINAKAKGLIVDLRYNRGGGTPSANHLQKYFTKSDSFLNFGAMYRINNGYRRSQGKFNPNYEYVDVYLNKAFETSEPRAVQKEAYIEFVKCPTVFLIGKQSYSACEDLLLNMYELSDRPLFIGEETGGSTGAPLVVNLPHEALARICTLKILYPYSKKPFVRKGVIPDIEIKQSMEDRKTGRDIVKEKAVQRLKTNVLVHIII